MRIADWRPVDAIESMIIGWILITDLVLFLTLVFWPFWGD